MNDRSNESVIKLEPTRDVLTELFRNSAIKVLQAALELEVSDIMASFEARKLDDGRQAVCRSGYHPEQYMEYIMLKPILFPGPKFSFLNPDKSAPSKDSILQRIQPSTSPAAQSPQEDTALSGPHNSWHLIKGLDNSVSVETSLDDCQDYEPQPEPKESYDWALAGINMNEDKIDSKNFGGRLHTPRDCFFKALELDSKNAHAWLLLGASVLSGSKDKFQVGSKVYSQQDCFIKTINLDPSIDRAWRYLGQTLPDNKSQIEVNGTLFTKMECFMMGLKVLTST